jgi:hypothetical protein
VVPSGEECIENTNPTSVNNVFYCPSIPGPTSTPTKTVTKTLTKTPTNTPTLTLTPTTNFCLPGCYIIFSSLQQQNFPLNSGKFFLFDLGTLTAIPFTIPGMNGAIDIALGFNNRIYTIPQTSSNSYTSLIRCSRFITTNDCTNPLNLQCAPYDIVTQTPTYGPTVFGRGLCQFFAPAGGGFVGNSVVVTQNRWNSNINIYSILRVTVGSSCVPPASSTSTVLFDLFPFRKVTGDIKMVLCPADNLVRMLIITTDTVAQPIPTFYLEQWVNLPTGWSFEGQVNLPFRF